MLGVVGQIFGVLAGFALALILIYVINVQSFGWTIQFHVPVAFLLQASALLLVVTTLAGAYPARGCVADIDDDEGRMTNDVRATLHRCSCSRP